MLQYRKHCEGQAEEKKPYYQTILYQKLTTNFLYTINIYTLGTFYRFTRKQGE